MSDIEIKQTKSFIRSVLTAARAVSGREVTLGPDGIVVSDPLGDRHTLSTKEPFPGIEALRSTLDDSEFHSWKRNGDISVSGHGNWKIRDAEGVISLKTTKPRFAALESIFDADEKELAALRGIYGHENVDIVVACEGEMRARDTAIAFATELALSNRNVDLKLPAERKYNPRSDSPSGYETAAYQEGAVIIENALERTGTSWEVILADGRVSMTGIEHAKPGVSRVIIWADDSMARRFSNIDDKAFSVFPRPCAALGIPMVKSKAVGKVTLSEAAVALPKLAENVENAPWTRHNDRKAARLKARPPAPKTWHSSTAAVGEAFVARQAPRGYVSGNPIYFHGPVAYSLYDANPIAAFVDMPNGEAIILMGRDADQRGTLAATVSSAIGDIHEAAREAKVKTFWIGELNSFLTLGGETLNAIASITHRNKNEHEYPSSCAIDVEKLGTYLLERKAAAEHALDQAFVTSFPTFTKATAYKDLANVVNLRDTLASMMKIELPPVGDGEHYIKLGNDMAEKTKARQHQLEQRRKEKETANNLALPLPAP